jgi:hypothetical protein
MTELEKEAKESADTISYRAQMAERMVNLQDSMKKMEATQVSESEIVKLTERLKALTDSMTKLEERVITFELELIQVYQKLDSKVDCIQQKYANRLPVWATIAFSILTAMVGALMSGLVK